MDAVATIVEAVTQGASAGATDAVSNAVTRTFDSLVALLRRRFAGETDAEAALEQQLENPEGNPQELSAHVGRLPSSAQGEIVMHAEQLLTLLASRRDSYTIDATTVNGLVQGNNNDVSMRFSSD